MTQIVMQQANCSIYFHEIYKEFIYFEAYCYIISKTPKISKDGRQIEISNKYVEISGKQYTEPLIRAIRIYEHSQSDNGKQIYTHRDDMEKQIKYMICK